MHKTIITWRWLEKVEDQTEGIGKTEFEEMMEEMLRVIKILFYAVGQHVEQM